LAKRKRASNALLTRRFWAVFLVISLIGIASWAASPITTRIQQEKELAALSRQRDGVRADNRRLRQEIERLKDDPEYWEMMARRDLRYVKSDERAYVVIEQEPPVEDTTASTPSSPTLWEQVKVQVKELSVLF